MIVNEEIKMPRIGGDILLGLMGLGTFVLGTAAVASTVTGICSYYAGKSRGYEEGKPQKVYVQNITLDEKENQKLVVELVVENYREERFGFVKQSDGTYKSLDEKLKEIENQQKKIVDDLKKKIGGN